VFQVLPAPHLGNWGKFAKHILNSGSSAFDPKCSAEKARSTKLVLMNSQNAFGSLGLSG